MLPCARNETGKNDKKLCKLRQSISSQLNLIFIYKNFIVTAAINNNGSSSALKLTLNRPLASLFPGQIVALRESNLFYNIHSARAYRNRLILFIGANVVHRALEREHKESTKQIHRLSLGINVNLFAPAATKILIRAASERRKRS
jgi:hypothetical protein